MYLVLLEIVIDMDRPVALPNGIVLRLADPTNTPALFQNHLHIYAQNNALTFANIKIILYIDLSNDNIKHKGTKQWHG